MTLLERAFFGLFVLWSRWKGYEEFTVLTAIVCLFLTSLFNILTILSFSMFFTENRLVVFPSFLNSQLNVSVTSVLWFILLAALFIRREQLRKYRKELENLREVDNKRIRMRAFAYVAGSIFLFFFMAIVMVNRIPGSS